ncbi:MAG: DUF2336 domain-containing protein [Alphaproteobacteria bacterium]|nr:DUF2336 domain-containing protein [Alphaproteobacteria bacterium]
MSQFTEISEDTLIDMARQRSRESRSRLFENIADLFMSDAGRLSDRERALINGILNKLLHSVERDVRLALAERLRMSDQAPPELVALLANDDFEIARPILRDSPLLRDGDLIAVIKDRSQEHRLAIAARRHLSPDVGDALIETGDPDVIEELLRNSDSALSQHAMSYLVAEAHRTDRFHEPLLQRSELPPQLAHKLYWVVSAALRRRILQTFRFPEAVFDEMMEASTEGLLSGSVEPSIQALSADLAAGLDRSGRITPELLVNLLRRAHVPAFLSTFARYVPCPDTLIRRVVFTRDSESLTVLCKSSRMDRKEFADLFVVLQTVTYGLRPMSPQLLRDTLTFYDGLTVEKAEAARRHWSLNTDYLAAIDSLAEDRWSRPGPAPAGAVGGAYG